MEIRFRGYFSFECNGFEVWRWFWFFDGIYIRLVDPGRKVQFPGKSFGIIGSCGNIENPCYEESYKGIQNVELVFRVYTDEESGPVNPDHKINDRITVKTDQNGYFSFTYEMPVFHPRRGQERASLIFSTVPQASRYGKKYKWIPESEPFPVGANKIRFNILDG